MRKKISGFVAILIHARSEAPILKIVASTRSRNNALTIYDSQFSAPQRVWVSPVEQINNRELIVLIVKSKHENVECLEGLCERASLSRDGTQLVSVHA